jgi:GntP family gluconate:H+ symporter
MHPDLLRLIGPLLSIALLVLLITRLKLHPFLALILASGFLGLVSGLAPAAVITTFERGFGGILSTTGLVVGLGSMLGGLLLESGGADRIASAFTSLGPARTIPITMCAAALLIGLPHLFDVSFVMLVPLVYTVAQRSRQPLLRVGLPMAAGLYVSHGLLPPHPSPTLAMAVFHADAGRTVMYGLLIALPMAVLSGPIFTAAVVRGGLLAAGRPDGSVNPLFATPAASAERRRLKLPVVLLTILLPPGLMMLCSFGRGLLAPGSMALTVLDGIGDPVVSLLIAVLVAILVLGIPSGLAPAEIQKLLGRSLLPAAGIILILGAGGGFKDMFVATHIGDMIAHWATQWHISPLLLAWSTAALIRIAVGSATVATATAAGIVAPIAAATPGISPELLVLATSTGGLMLSHVNDSGFWLFKEYFQLTVPQTLRSWTLLVSFQSLLGLAGVLILHALLG